MYKHKDKITYAIDPAIKTAIGSKGRANVMIISSCKNIQQNLQVRVEL